MLFHAAVAVPSAFQLPAAHGQRTRIRWTLRACSCQPPASHTCESCCDADARCDPFCQQQTDLALGMEAMLVVPIPSDRCEVAVVQLMHLLCPQKAHPPCVHVQRSHLVTCPSPTASDPRTSSHLRVQSGATLLTRCRVVHLCSGAHRVACNCKLMQRF